jgi:hypothetical protein
MVLSYNENLNYNKIVTVKKIYGEKSAVEMKLENFNYLGQQSVVA